MQSVVLVVHVQSVGSAAQAPMARVGVCAHLEWSLVHAQSTGLVVHAQSAGLGVRTFGGFGGVHSRLGRWC